MHHAMLWEALKDSTVACRLCNHYCVIKNYTRGKCGVRENRNGELFTLVGDTVAAINLDPIEKKPLFHFQPGSRTLSFGTQGCNFHCSFCQNADLSQSPAQGKRIQGQQVSPDFIVETALRHGASSIAYTYSEPTIFFELMYNTAKAAHAAGLKNVMVSNGYQSPQCLELLGPYIDAANIDLKAFTDSFYKDYIGASLKPILKTLETIVDLGWWLEVTTLLIPDANDSKEELAQLANFIAEKLGKDVPWHISRFHPTYKLTDRGITSERSLLDAYNIGIEAGLNYVYVGNIPGNTHENTVCPKCSSIVINRLGFNSDLDGLRNGNCAQCGFEIKGMKN
ncbi:MAG: AmmeMemoRadiSam system radical SAM enzyme [Desulfovibrio sp.]